MWYLHGPDWGTDLEDMVRGVNKLYKEGLVERWGVRNPCLQKNVKCDGNMFASRLSISSRHPKKLEGHIMT